MQGLKRGAIASFVIAMSILLIGGYFAIDKVPPYPEQVSYAGNTLFTKDDIIAGQKVYQRYGLMDHGSIWGHGGLRGVDFSAETLHQIGVHMRDFYAQEKGSTYSALSSEDKALIDARVIDEIKTNNYNESNKTLTVTEAHTYAFGEISEYWNKIFRDGDSGSGFLENTIADQQQRDDISKFFIWTAWSASADRPGEDYSYTNDWPPDRSVGNDVSSDAFIWSIVSILALFVILGLIIYIVHRYKFFYGEAKGIAIADELTKLPLTNSQFKAAKFFLVVSLLFILQTCMGGLLAHYTVHPGTFFLSSIASFIPYSWAKTWHLQLAIFWIATSWVASAIYLAPLISNREPKGQGLLVNLLFGAILIVAVGSLTGEVLSIKGLLGDETWFWFGHQGWEYLELGRVWQILLFIGLIFWLLIVYRAIKEKLFGPKKDESGLVMFYTLSAIMVVSFFGFGLFYGPETHLTIADYWRWFVVHLWVESIFEFFGVAVISVFLVTLGLVDKKSAMKVAYLTAILVFSGGIIGTAHHYFWYGGPSYWLALGAVFSSLEPIPLIMLVVRAWLEYKSINDAGKDFAYRWPLLFLTASSFWNFLGAGVFGFLINLPVINYYEHATYLTANHGHAAMFGVYGMLSISVVLYTWRSLIQNEHWNDKLLKISFYGLNGGLFLMTIGTLFPVGLAQTLSSFRDGFWYARSSHFYTSDFTMFFGQIRAIPDMIIIVFGAIPLFIFLVKTYTKLKPIGYKENEKIMEKEIL